ncbi:MAG: HAD-IC family P-type ATPase [Phreatobacter sp.]|nr:HAD-IC family P-type ATPase [Phreatobacter sp.]
MTEGPLVWHAAPAEACLEALDSAPSGLSGTEASARLVRDGPNRLPEEKRRGVIVRFLLQFHNLLIYILCAAAITSAILGHVVDAAVIGGVVLINAIVGFVQEGKAERALDAIRAMIDPKASVFRDGARLTVAADDIVSGDIVHLEAGDRVPADLRLIRARNLKIDEAVLTGESVPVEKAVAPVNPDASLGDRRSMAYSGTLVATGQATGVVVGTGLRTELGRIGQLLGRIQQLQTPLLAQMEHFARQVTVVILVVSAAAFAFAVWVRGYGASEAFMVVVGLAVSAIPEGLPAVLTITLAVGVQRMARRSAIIRLLPAVETLGSVSVICSDKTGTLTRNEMTVRSAFVDGVHYEVAGVGYGPDGAISRAGMDIDPEDDPRLSGLMRAAALCNDAELRQSDGVWTVDGDPMEGALVAFAEKGGLDVPALRKSLPRTDEIPFDAAHRFMATLHHDHQGRGFILVKGAPERILALSSTEQGETGASPLDRATWHARADELAAEGQRVLGFATIPAKPGQQTLAFDDVGPDLILLGLVGFIDPPREEAIQAIAECHAAGIRVIMITGDHAVTAREIGQQLGLAHQPVVRTGDDVDRLDDAQLAVALRDTTVFARTSPEHKLRIVSALQAQGLTVAMTGDGVNDAPALKRADVGVAMGQKGTEAAKQAAEIVLADDNFASIVAAVKEGRTVYDNLRKVIGWTLPTNGGEAMIILGAIALGWTLPITAVQILWVNMVTAVALGLTLAFEPAEPGSMARPPRRRDAPLLSGELAWRILFASSLFSFVAFAMFFRAEQRGLPIEESRTIVVNTIVVMEIVYLFSVRYVHGPSLTWQGVLGTKAVLAGVGLTIVAQFCFTYAPPLQTLFQTRPVALMDGILVIGAGVLTLLVLELEKKARALLWQRTVP